MTIIHSQQEGDARGPDPTASPGGPRAAIRIGVSGFGRHVPSRSMRSSKQGDRMGPLEVVRTPGRAPGCLSFWWPEQRALFIGA